MYVPELINVGTDQVILRNDYDDQDYIAKDVVSYIDEDGEETNYLNSSGIVFAIEGEFYMLKFAEFENPTLH